MTVILAHKDNFTQGRTKEIDRIVLHYTAGDGDTAENNGKYFAGGGRNASAHYFVDEKGVVQSVADGDTAWHAGNWEMNCRSIGVEMCSKKDGAGNYYIPAATVKNAQTLVKHLMAKHSIDIDGVIRHYDVTGKACPAPMVAQEKWKAFLSGLMEPQAASWAAEAWENAKAKGVLDGTRPSDALTRQELAVILQRLKLI